MEEMTIVYILLICPILVWHFELYDTLSSVV